MAERYKPVVGSILGHCCHTASVVDTSRPDDDEEGHIVCECLTMERAEAVATALNAADLNTGAECPPA